MPHNTSVVSILAFVSFLTSTFSAAFDKADGRSIISSNPRDYTYDQLKRYNPEEWGEIKGYETCVKGYSQSPINFPLKVKIDGISFAPKPKLKMVNLKLYSKIENWALECTEKHKCGFTKFNQRKYFVSSLHFHSPSEHTLNGKQYPLEAHLVHVSNSGDLAVLSTLFDYPSGRPYVKQILEANSSNRKHFRLSPFVKTIFDQLIDKRQKEVAINLKHLTKRGGICSYNGSLTTPPCSENVMFLMQLNVQTVSRFQVKQFQISFGSQVYGNNRPIQSLNKREVTCYLTGMK